MYKLSQNLTTIRTGILFYYVENGIKLDNPKGSLHSIINPNKDPNKWVIIKESWSGKFDEEDIERIFNPNHYN